MTKQELANRIAELIKADGYETEVRTVRKNNATEMIGVVIRKGSESIAPTFYMENYIEDYENGRSVTEICDEILTRYHQERKTNIAEKMEDFVESLKDFNIARRLLKTRLRKKSWNQDLENLYIGGEFQDFYICYAIEMIENNHLGASAVMLTNEIIKMWFPDDKLSENDIRIILKVEAEQNELSDYELTTMSEKLKSFMGDSFDFALVEDESMELMWILSNANNVHGGSYLKNKEIMKKVCDRLGEDQITIIPSSVHEVIILRGLMHGQDEIIQEVNETQVNREEQLSDHAYYFDRKEEKFFE